MATARNAAPKHREGPIDVKPPSLPSSAWYIFMTAATVVIVAEIGCLARTALLTMRYGHPWIVFAGTMVGTAVTMGVGIVLGDLFHERVPASVMRWVSGVFFMGLGLLMALGKIEG
jgi:putative Ca2+/H+ antiporter (TMEM165/GDT1 family)